MTLAKKLLPTLLSGALATVFLIDPGIHAQDPALPKGPFKGKLAPGEIAQSFEVATIKPNKSDNGKGEFRGAANGLTLKNFSPMMVLKMAFGNLADNRITGAPKWMESDHYDIAGQFEEGKRAAPPDMFQPALRKLLADRFNLKFHWEPREAAVFDLVVAKGGHKLKQNTDGQGPGGMGRPGQFTAHGLTMAVFANRLGGNAGRIVVDKTGLTGQYDFELTWTPEIGAAPGADPAGPSLFTAIQEQLGLRLEPGKTMLDTMVIDSIDKRSEN